MTIDTTYQPLAPSTIPPIDVAGPDKGLRLQMHVIGDKLNALGTLDALEHDSATGDLTAVKIRHGLYSQRLTTVQAELVEGVEQDLVVLRISKADFMQLPRIEKDH